MPLLYTILILTCAVYLIGILVELKWLYAPTLHTVCQTNTRIHPRGLLILISYIHNFDEVYDAIKKKSVIKRHHQKYINDKYAPAWKTVEYMTFGNIKSLYLNLKNPADKLDICRHFGVKQTAIFENYTKIVRTLRNTCHHQVQVYLCWQQYAGETQHPLSGGSSPAVLAPSSAASG